MHLLQFEKNFLISNSKIEEEMRRFIDNEEMARR